MASMLDNLFGSSSGDASNNNNNTTDNNNLSVESAQRNKSRYASCNDWLADISSRQQSNVTPEIRQRIQEKARRQKVRARKKKRAKVYQRAAECNKRAWHQGNLRVMNSAPQFYESSAASSRMQMRSIQGLYRRNEVSYEDDAAASEEEEELECMVSRLEVAQLEDNADHTANVDENSMRQILNQLRKEPKDEKEITAKFGLYEDYLATVEDSRNATHNFWKECKPDFEAVDNSEHVIKTIEKEIKAIDAEDNLSIIWSETRWFVYDMTKKADQNNDKLKACLHNLEIKLDLLDKEDECPFCLEAGNESVTLGCCHKACKECWTHWQQIKGSNAFCPLCRQGDFLENMAEAQN